MIGARQEMWCGPRAYLAVCALGVLFAAAAVEARSEAPTASAAGAAQGGEPTQDLAWQLLVSLSTEIGPRLAGSTAEARAREWAVRKLRDLGFHGARIEPVAVAHWSRGRASAVTTHPTPRELVVAALGNSSATPASGLEAEVVRFASVAQLMQAPAELVAGRIVFVDERMQRSRDGSGYQKAVLGRTRTAIEAGRRGAVAALIRSATTAEHAFAHTGTVRYAARVAVVPIAALAPSDASYLSRALERGPVRVRLLLETRGGGRVLPAWDGDARSMSRSGNVIAEIPGRSDELLLLGAHLDSWDLGTGAADNAAGVAIVIAAASRVAQRSQQPHRTIRLVLFGAEEFDAAGAHAYARAHAAELPRHALAVESDLGAARIWRVRTGWAPEHRARAADLLRVLRPYGVADGGNSATGGPDLQPLRAAGVPVVSLDQDASEYYEVHHSALDTLDRIDREQLAQNVDVYAAFLRWAVDTPGSLRASAPASATPSPARKDRP